MKMMRADTDTYDSNEAIDKSPPNYRAPALDKGLDIIEVLALSGHSMTLAAISEKLNKSVSELFRMVRVLERREYIVLPKGKTEYELTDKLARLGMSCGDSKASLDYNLPGMRRVRKLEEENAKLRRIVTDLLIEQVGAQNINSNDR